MIGKFARTKKGRLVLRKLASSDAVWYMLFNPVRQPFGYATYVESIAVAQILVNNIAMLKSRKYICFGNRQQLTSGERNMWFAVK